MHLLIILLDPAVLLPELLHFSFHFAVPLLVHLLLMRDLLINLLHLFVNLLDQSQSRCLLLRDLRQLELTLL